MNTTTQVNTPQDVIPNRQNISLMLNTAWQVLQVGLYPFSRDAQSESLAKTFIRDFIGTGGDAYAMYAEFCQRILMTRHCIIGNPRFLFNSTLVHWLDPENKQGFARSKKWFARLQEKRRPSPMHLLELKAFPEAVLELAEEVSADNFHYWHNWFMERGATDQVLLLQLVGVQLAFTPGCIIHRAV